MPDRPRERTINHTPREHLPAEVRALAEALKHLRFMGEPGRAADLEARNRGAGGWHDPDLDPDRDRRFFRGEYDRYRMQIQRMARDILHDTQCDTSDIASWERLCPHCGANLRAAGSRRARAREKFQPRRRAEVEGPITA